MADVCRMLDECAPDHSRKVTTHSIFVKLAGKTARLPRGEGRPRGVKIRDLRGIEVRTMQLKKLVQDLGIDRACAAKYFPDVFKDAEPAPSST